MKEVLIERFILVLGAGGQENVATDVLVHDLAVRTQAGKRHLEVLVELDHHLKEGIVDKLKLGQGRMRKKLLYWSWAPEQRGPLRWLLRWLTDAYP